MRSRSISCQLALLHHRDTETQRKTKNDLFDLRGFPKDDEAVSTLPAASLAFLLYVSVSLWLNSSLVTQSNRRGAETQRQALIGNLRALCRLCALPIPKDDEAASTALAAFLVFLLCVSASPR